MKSGTPARLLVSLTALGTVLAACGGIDGSTTDATQAAADTETTADSGTTADTATTAESGTTAATTGDSTSETDATDTADTATAGEATVDTASCPDSATKPLADGEPIKIGMTIATSGPLSGLKALADGSNAYFDKVNAAGGIDGHQIELIVVDDAFDAARSVTNVKELTQKDEVLAIYLQTGTSLIKGAQPIAEQTCTPQLWSSTGDGALGDDPDTHPWTTAHLVPYDRETELWTNTITGEFPDGARIAMLTANNDQGTVYQSGMKAAVEGTPHEIVAVETYDSSAPSIDPQITALLASKPDVVLGAPDNQNCPKLLTGLANGGFEGRVILSATCNSIDQHFNVAGEAANGAMVLSPYRDPGNPADNEGPAMDEYRSDMAEYVPDANPDLGYTATGYNLAAILVSNLEAAAASDGGLSRASLMEAAWHTDTAMPLGAEGLTQQLDGAADPILFNEVQLLEYDAANKSLVPVGLVSFES